MTLVETLCQEFKLAPWQVEAVISLLDEGNTLPFIARYRKEAHAANCAGQRRHYGSVGGYLSSLQAQAPHSRHDCA